MSWMKETKCPVCGTDGFDPDCDEVDIDVGVQEGNLRGVCRRCGNVAQDGETGWWEVEFPPPALDDAYEGGRAVSFDVEQDAPPEDPDAWMKPPITLREAKDRIEALEERIRVLEARVEGTSFTF